MNVHRAPSRDPSNEGTFSVRLFGFVFNLKAGVEVFFLGPLGTLRLTYTTYGGSPG